jgi:hypothetical protein
MRHRNETYKRFVIQAWLLKNGRQPGNISHENYVHFGYLGHGRIKTYEITNKKHAIHCDSLQEATQILTEWKNERINDNWDGVIKTLSLCHCGCNKELKYSGNGRPPRFLSNAHRQRAFRQRRNETS